jgi:plastocyanin
MITKVTYTIIGLLIAFSSIGQTAYQLIGRNTGSKLLHDGNSVRIFGFAKEFGENPPIPGPTLTFTENDSIILDFWNISQGAPHTIHLHGLDVNQANDGVPHLSFEVHHNEHGFYRFVAPHAGTYLYHCHVVSSIHVQAGMYGLIVVKPADSNMTWADGYEYQTDINWMFSEIDTMWHHDSVLLHDYDTTMGHHMIPIPIYEPQHFLINGLSEQQLEDEVEIHGQANSSIYMRMANIGYLANRISFPAALNATIIDSDGRPLPTPETSNVLEIYPGERYGVLLEPTEEFVSTARVDFINLNTGQIDNQQTLDVNIEGFYGIESLTEEAITVAPNPTSGFISIVAPQEWIGRSTKISVFDIAGNLILNQSEPLNAIHELNLSKLSPGVYTLSLTSKTGSVTKSIVLR